MFEVLSCRPLTFAVYTINNGSTLYSRLSSLWSEAQHTEPNLFCAVGTVLQVALQRDSHLMEYSYVYTYWILNVATGISVAEASDI